MRTVTINCNVNGKRINTNHYTWRKTEASSGTLIGYSNDGDVICITATKDGYSIDIQSDKIPNFDSMNT